MPRLPIRAMLNFLHGKLCPRHWKSLWKRDIFEEYGNSEGIKPAK
jgi:hypothetical protein